MLITKNHKERSLISKSLKIVVLKYSNEMLIIVERKKQLLNLKILAIY